MLQTIFTGSGPRQVLTPNFCANSRLYGYEQDINTGGKCTYTDDQLPDENCYYYVTEQTRSYRDAMVSLVVDPCILVRLWVLFKSE